MKTLNPRLAMPVLAMVVGAVLAGCSSVSEVTRERVARSETAVQQATQTVGRSESGALELQRAREQLDAARRALDEHDAQQAERAATRAQLDAELAVAKSQSAAARKAADELLASIKTLREEAARGGAGRM
jgi:predicted  nucleic acid-binding Zn-ribbon protein